MTDDRFQKDVNAQQKQRHEEDPSELQLRKPPAQLLADEDTGQRGHDGKGGSHPQRCGHEPASAESCRERYRGAEIKHAHRLDELVARQADPLKEHHARHRVRTGHAGKDAIDQPEHRTGPALVTRLHGQVHPGEIDRAVGNEQHAEQGRQEIEIDQGQRACADRNGHGCGEEKRPDPAQHLARMAAGKRLPDIGEKRRHEHQRHGVRQADEGRQKPQ